MVTRNSDWQAAFTINHTLKRALDILMSSCALLLFLPLFGMIAIIIYFDDHGPVIFTQSRVGRYRKPFRILKFRTMSVGAEQGQGQQSSLIARDEFVVKRQHDVRVTRVGKWLRRWSLDELPQLINVLRGEMSLVGPRPFVATEIENCTPKQLQRLDVLPGITGWAQVHGRSNVVFDDIIQYDLWYAKHQSLWLDIKILLKTCLIVFEGKGAY